MANMKEILPKGDYKVKVVGPARAWEYQGTSMMTDSVQFEGFEQFWIDVNRKSDSPVPVTGDILKGHVEQDEAGKFSPKFKKESKGSWSGGGSPQASPGAIWATAMQTATMIVNGFYAASGTKPESLQAYFKQIKAVAPKVNQAVEAFVASAKPAAAAPADTTSSESGETQPAAAPAAAPSTVVVQDISAEDLGGESW